MKNMRNQETLSRWLVGIHNRVNLKLGKKLYKYSTVKKNYV
jgi:hypothetical protein